MKGNHPKRRKDKDNPYSIYEAEHHYYISFKDGQGLAHEFEIPLHIYDIFNKFELEDLIYLNVWDRHIEQSEMRESGINERSIRKPELVEDLVLYNIEKEQLYKAIEELPETQRRRVILYFFYDMTYEQIAKLEHCRHTAVIKSVKAALLKLKNILAE